MESQLMVKTYPVVIIHPKAMLKLKNGRVYPKDEIQRAVENVTERSVVVRL